MASGGPPSSITRYPFPPETAHFNDPRVGRAWYATGAGALIVQTTVTQATPLGARILCDWVDTALNRERQTLEQLGGLFLFHDWRSIKGYDSGTREQMVERMRARPRGYARRTIMVIEASPLMKMAITVADVTFALFGGKRTEVFHEIHKATRELGAIVPGTAPGWIGKN